MFRESLLESSKNKKRKRWPMALAFAGEIAVATLLVVIPLLTTGVISASAHVTPPIKLTDIHVVTSRPVPNTPVSGQSGPTTQVFAIENNQTLTIGTKHNQTDNPPLNPWQIAGIGSNTDKLTSLTHSDYGPPSKGNSKKGPIISVASEAYLVNRVEPIYPHIAVVTHTQGDVKLHAIIAKDGTIESLTVISGHPILVQAAVYAVKQWRYRPYILNGEPVEVETFVTVSFKGIRD